MTDEQRKALEILDRLKRHETRIGAYPHNKVLVSYEDLDTFRTALEPQTVDVGFIYRWGQSLRIRAIDWKKYPKDSEVAVKSLVKDLGITVKEDK